MQLHKKQAIEVVPILTEITEKDSTATAQLIRELMLVKMDQTCVVYEVNTCWGEVGGNND